MGILTNLVDNFFKSLQRGVSNSYQQEAQRQWDLDHPVETLKEQIIREQNEIEIHQQELLDNEKKEKEAKVNLEKYNKRVQKEKENFLRNHK